jgi:gliding motility-associated-like protein
MNLNNKVLYISFCLACYFLLNSYANTTASLIIINSAEYSNPLPISKKEIRGTSKKVLINKETKKVEASPIVNFTFSNDNSCSGEIVEFTNTSTGDGVLTYNWDFGDGSTSSEINPTHVFQALGCGTRIFEVLLTVTDENGNFSSETKTITVKEKPNIRFRDPNENDFSNCGNTSSNSNYEVTLQNISQSTTCITSYFIDWGDGNTTTSTTGDDTHTYETFGIFDLKIVANNGTTGCENEVTYEVKNISNPAGGFASPGATSNLCAPTESLIFGITNWGLNSSDTEYFVDFGDGSPREEFTQAQLEASASYNASNPENSLNFPTPHVYEEGTCSEVNDEFVITLTVENGCGSTDFTISNITILEPSKVEFDAVEEGCINTDIIFENLSTISDGKDCVKKAKFIWDFGDGTTKTIFDAETSLDENHTYTESGIYTVSLTIESFCTTATFSKDICISPEITTTFSVDTEEGCIPLIVKSTNTTVPTNLCSSMPTYEWLVSYTSDNCGTASDWNFTNATDETSENPEFIFNTPGKYTLTQNTTTVCGTETAIKIIDVKKPPTAIIKEITDVCGNASINPIAIVENCTSNSNEITYNWTFIGGAPAASTDVNPINIEYTTPGIYTISLEVTNACGVSNTSTEQFEVFEKPAISNTNLTQEICSTQSTSEISLTATNLGAIYSWTAVASSNITGFQATGNSDTIPSQTLTNLGNTIETVTFSVIPILDGCAGDITNFIITVNPTPIISTQPTSYEICLNGTATPLEVSHLYESGTPTYQWYSNTSDDINGGNPITNATNISYKPPTNVIGEIFYYVKISFTSGSCAEITSETASVLVVTQITVATVNALQTFCVGGTADEMEVTYAGGTGNATYQWFSNTTNTNSGGSEISGQTTSTYTPNIFTTVGDFYYYAEISLDGNGCNTASSAIFEVNVLADPVINTQAIASQELCQSATPANLTITTSGGTSSPKSYQWYQNNSNSNTSGTEITNANSDTYTPDTSLSGTFYYYVIVSQLETGCSVTGTISTLKIKEAPSISENPTSSEICLNGTPTLLEVTYKEGIGTPTYQWFSSTSDDITSGNPILNETNISYEPPADVIGETFYYVKINFNTSDCSEIISNTAAVNVVPQITVTTVNASQVICVGGTADEMEVTYAGGTGNATYQWFSNTTNINSGGSEISGQTTSTYTPNIFTTVGNFYYYSEISLDGNGCNTASSAIFKVNVLADPIINTQAIASQELCQNATPANLTITTSGGTSSAKSYQWYQNTTNSSSSATAITGENSAIYTPNTSAIGTLYYYVIISQTASGCSVTSAISMVKIKEAPSISTQPISSEVCLNGTPTLLEVTYQNGTGTPAYQWFSSIDGNTANGTAIADETNTTYNPPTSAVGEIFYYAEISFSSAGCAQVVSNTALVNVVPQITLTNVNASQVICVGGTADKMEITYSGGTGNATYQWFSNTTNTNSGGSEISEQTTSTYTPNAYTTIGDFYYYVKISLDGNGCASATSAVFKINVVTGPVIDTEAIATQELCQNALPENLIIEASGGTAAPKNYQWYQNTTNSTVDGTAIMGENSAVYTPNTNTIGTLYYYVIVSQSAASCSITSAISVVKIKEAPSISTQPASSGVCLNEPATLLEVAYQNGTGTPTYQWFSNTDNSTTNGTAIADETNTTYNPPTNIVGEIFYYAEIYFSSVGCAQVTSEIASIIVNEIPVIASAEIVIYSETTFNFNPNAFAINTIPAGTAYTWSTPTYSPANAIIGASAEASPQAEISQTLENTATTPIKVTYTITPATINCIGEPFILDVTVNPGIKTNAILTNNTCFESNDASITTNITGGIPFKTGKPYLISWIGPNGFSSTESDILNLEKGNYTLRVEDEEGYSITEEFIITQPAILAITRDLTRNISCFQGNDGIIELTVSGGTTPYLYNWTTSNGSGIIQDTKNQNTLTEGTYTLEVIDKNNCTIQTEIILIAPEELKIENVITQDVLCFGDATGTIEIDISGGTPIETSSGAFKYFYSWSGPNGFTSSSKNNTNLIAGTYNVTVTDNLDCVATANIIINQSSEVVINYTKKDVTCNGGSDGSIDIKVTGGVMPYKISWSNLANGFSLTDLTADTYVATITDANNCSKQTVILIEEPLFFVSPVVTPISCNDKKDGAINLNLTGGIAPLSVTWSDDPTAGIQRNNLAQGTYTVTITDSATTQCPIEETFTLTNPASIAISETIVDAIDCTIANSGSIQIETSGGTAPYSFLWNTGDTTKDLENIPPGDYTIEITDKNGCQLTKQFNIFRQEPLAVVLEESTITDCNLNSISKRTAAKVSGGFLPYTYSWSAGTVSNSDTSVMNTSQNGAYTLTVTDDKGCTKSKSFIIDIPIIGDADFRYSAFALDTYNLLSIEDPIQFTNLSTGNYNAISWDFGDGSPIVFEENPIHTYDEVGTFTIILKIVYNTGCIVLVERIVNITKGYSLINPNAFTPNGDGFNEAIRPSLRGFTTIEMTIFNTWGTAVYYEKGVDLKGWNGNIKGSPAENGNYVMVVKGLTFYNKEIITTSPLTLLK